MKLTMNKLSSKQTNCFPFEMEFLALYFDLFVNNSNFRIYTHLLPQSH